LRSFLKWAGNKFQLLDKIKAVLPPGKRLIEPFAGSGVVSLNTDYASYFLSDNNGDLINLFNALKEDGTKFIEYTRKWFVPENNQADRYYQYRTEFNSETDPYRKSALFIYLNRHSFNGLCRYNASGVFNVPFGLYDKPLFPEEAMLHFCKKSKRAVFEEADFTAVMENAEQGDVIYCDPPYVPLSDTAKFTAYSAGAFNEAEQIKLASHAEQCARRGIPVILSNHDTPYTRELYKNAEIQSFEVNRHISRDWRTRKPVKEVLAVFLP